MNSIDWLYANAGPIIRWRLVQDFQLPVAKKEKETLLQEVVSHPDVQNWLQLLGSRYVHGSKDTNAENPMAKLYEFGLRKGYAPLDDKCYPYIENLTKTNYDWIPPEVPFLIALGYTDEPIIRDIFITHLHKLEKTAQQSDFHFQMPQEETKALPKTWRDKKVYKKEYGCPNTLLPLPSIYDLIALSTWPMDEPTQKPIETVLQFICDPRFQDIFDGYMWDSKLKRCYSAGRVYLAVFIPQRKLMFLERIAKFKAAQNSLWFQEALQELETYRNESGRYEFPATFLVEKESYYTYSGAHMGLGENRRQGTWREIESTFRMENIKRQLL